MLAERQNQAPCVENISGECTIYNFTPEIVNKFP